MLTRRLKAAITILFLAQTFPSLVEASTPKKVLMASLGDSITAASLADLPIPGAGPAEAQITAWANRELDSRFIFENKGNLSWASGQRIDSHFMKLKRWLKKNGDPRTLDELNVAYPGDTSYDLDGQVKQIVNAMSSGRYDELEYVTILIGANDACSTESPVGTPPDKLEANLMNTFTQLASIQQKTPIRIMVVGIPRIPDLATPAYRNGRTIFGLSCETVRNGILHFCNSLLEWKTPTEYEQKMQIVENTNQLLQDVVWQANAFFPNLDVVYSDRLYNLAIPLSVLAIDCFHPNNFGQSSLSDQVWLDQPWFD